MFYLRTISLATIFISSISSANAAKLDQDFQRCASAAFEGAQQSAVKVSVDNGGLSPRELDHNASSDRLVYRMRVNSRVSGKDMGSITCTLSRFGKIISANFD